MHYKDKYIYIYIKPTLNRHTRYATYRTISVKALS